MLFHVYSFIITDFLLKAASYHNLEEVEVLGAIIYTGTDATTRQKSTLFTGSLAGKEVIKSQDMRKILNCLTMMVMYVHQLIILFYLTH
jgi:hypothetical protein